MAAASRRGWGDSAGAAQVRVRYADETEETVAADNAQGRIRSLMDLVPAPPVPVPNRVGCFPPGLAVPLPAEDAHVPGDAPPPTVLIGPSGWMLGRCAAVVAEALLREGRAAAVVGWTRVLQLFPDAGGAEDDGSEVGGSEASELGGGGVSAEVQAQRETRAAREAAHREAHDSAEWWMGKKWSAQVSGCQSAMSSGLL